MNYTIRILLFLILVVIQILMDNKINKCKNIYGKYLLIFHHFISIYNYFGSILLGHHLLHLIIVICAGLVFLIDNKCPITKWHNELCNFDEIFLFNTYVNIIFGNKYAKIIHIILIILVILYDLYYINKQYKFMK